MNLLDKIKKLLFKKSVVLKKEQDYSEVIEVVDVVEEKESLKPELTLEEKKLLNLVEKLINRQKLIDLDVMTEIVRESFADFNINERRKSYITEGKLDWTIIYADYYENLLPNIIRNKQEVLEILRLIIQLNDEYVRKNEFELKELYNQKTLFFKKYKLFVEIFSEYQDKRQNFLSGLSEADYQNILHILFLLKSIVETTATRISENDISSEELKNINLKITNMVNQLNRMKKGTGKQKITEIIETYSLDNAKTLILLLGNDKGNFVPINDINKDLTIEQIRKHELQRAIIKISNVGMCDNKRKFKSSIITYTDSTGKEYSLRKNFGFEVDRIRFSDFGRTGYVIVPVHEENRKKLIEIYGKNIFTNYNSIILIIGSIKCSANHLEYTQFKKIIDENLEYINNIINLFKNPNSNIKDLINIIEDSAKACKMFCTENIKK